MAIVKGAMIGGSFLPEQEFKEIIKEYFDKGENVVRIRTILNTILQHKDNPKIIYNNIEKLETELLKNPATSLLVITNYKSPTGEYKWYYKSKESKVVTKTGLLSYAETIKKSLLEQQYTEILSQHLRDLINTVETEKFDDKNDDDDENSNDIIGTLDEFFGKNSKVSVSPDRIKRMGHSAHYQNSLMNVIYGDTPEDQRRGKIADAFLNHLGNMHRAIFTGGIETITPFTRSVKEEEGPHFLQLLADSANNAGWWTGGDLILVNNNQVIANIQLKTILNTSDSSVGTIRTTEILNQVQQLRDFIEKDVVYNRDKFANIMYDTFKTSAIFDKVSKKITEDAVEIVRQELNLTK